MRLPATLKVFLQSIRWLRSLVRRWRTPDLAALERSLARGSQLAVMQPWTTSSEERYPALFDQLAGLLDAVEAPRILSFGCAGGEEVRAIRRRLPNATIVGVDPNPRALHRARRADRHPLSCYLVGDRPPPGEPFDAALALAVFRHGELGQQKPERCSDALPFSRAAEIFAAVDAALRPGGVLAWGNAHFHLADLPGGDSYEFIAESADLDVFEVTYGPNDRRVAANGDRGGLYRKRA